MREGTLTGQPPGVISSWISGQKLSGGGMRKLVVLAGILVVSSSLGSPGLLRAAPQASMKEQIKLFRSNQKRERKNLKLQQKNRRRSLKQGQAPRAVRLEEKHKMQREAREMRQRQKDELQDLKDRQRLTKEIQSRS
jgi:hypothetical protein